MAGEAAAEAQDGAAVRDMVEHDDLLGEADRIVPGDDDHLGAERDPAGAAGEVGQRLQRIGAERIVAEMMLGDPDQVEAQLLRQHAILELLAEEPGVRIVMAALVREAGAHADMHAALPLFVVRMLGHSAKVGTGGAIGRTSRRLNLAWRSWGGKAAHSDRSLPASAVRPARLGVGGPAGAPSLSLAAEGCGGEGRRPHRPFLHCRACLRRGRRRLGVRIDQYRADGGAAPVAQHRRRARRRRSSRSSCTRRRGASAARPAAIWVGPLALGIAVGRSGCLFAGLPDETFGDPDRPALGRGSRRRRAAPSGPALREPGDARLPRRLPRRARRRAAWTSGARFLLCSCSSTPCSASPGSSSSPIRACSGRSTCFSFSRWR